MSRRERGVPAVGALGLILLITAGWWALALWPLTTTAPEWLARTRYVCFGATLEGLPDAGGWILLIGQPLGMLLLLMAVWPDDLRAGMRWLLERVPGQITAGLTAAAIVLGAAGAVARVRDANAAPFAASESEALSRQLTRLQDEPPVLRLIGQSGDTVRLEQYHGRAVLVTFAFGNCATVCPLVVHAALSARDRVASTAPERTPAVLVVTLDPWRDTPSRLASIATQWGMSGDAHVLSGEAEVVERTLNAWRIPRVRNERTGDISHPTMVYVIGPNGRITYVVDAIPEQIIAALQAL